MMKLIDVAIFLVFITALTVLVTIGMVMIKIFLWVWGIQ
jgi:hypothetical protein